MCYLLFLGDRSWGQKEMWKILSERFEHKEVICVPHIEGGKTNKTSNYRTIEKHRTSDTTSGTVLTDSVVHDPSLKWVVVGYWSFSINGYV